MIDVNSLLKEPVTLPPLTVARLALDGFMVQNRRRLPRDLWVAGKVLQDFIKYGCTQTTRHVDFYVELVYMYMLDCKKSINSDTISRNNP